MWARPRVLLHAVGGVLARTRAAGIASCQHQHQHLHQHQQHVRRLATTRAPLPNKPAATASDVLTGHPNNNVTPSIAERIGRNLHRQQDHPLNNIKHVIETHFNKLSEATEQRPFEVGSTKQCCVVSCCRPNECRNELYPL